MKLARIACYTAIQLALWGAANAHTLDPSDDPKPAVSAEETLKDRPLTLVRQIRPQYPDAARKDGLSGQVQLEAVIDEEGSVESVKTLAGHPILAEAAAAAVRRWLYQCAVVDGKPVKSKTVIKLNFKAPESR